MATLNINWNNSAVAASSDATGQRVSYRISPTSNNPGATNIWTTTGLTPSNDLPKIASAATFTGLSNVKYEVRVETLCTTGGPVENTSGLVEGLKFACISSTLTPNGTKGGNPATELLYTSNFVGTDIYKIRVILKKTSDNSTVGDQTFFTTQGGDTTQVFTGLLPVTSYYAQTIMYAIINGVDTATTLTTCLTSNVSTENVPEGNPNLIFNWDRTSGDAMDLTYVVSPQQGVNGTHTQVDWGDGTVNNLMTHTYTTTGNFTVSFYNSTATTVVINHKDVTDLIKVPNTLQVLDFSFNNIATYPVITNTNLVGVSFNQNAITNAPDFTGTPNLNAVQFENNLITGVVDFTVLMPTLQTISFRTNSITSINSLVGFTNIIAINFAENSITAMPNFVNLTSAVVIDFNTNSISGVLDVSNCHNLVSISFSDNTLISMPSFATNTLLQAIGLNNTTISGTLNLIGLTVLSNVIANNNAISNITGINTTALYSYSFSNNNLSTSVVNNLLTKADSMGMTGTFLAHTDGQTPSAPPSGAGITSKANLISRTYSVATD